MSATTINSQETNELIVDLQNKNQASQEVRRCKVTLPCKYFFLGIARASRPVDFRLEVSYTIDKRLVVKKGASVLYLQYRDKEGPNITVPVGEDGRVLDFQLHFDSTKIVDCTEKETGVAELFGIEYTIKAINVKTNKEAYKVNGEAKIRIQKLSYGAPIVTFEPNKVGANLVYSINETKPIVIGNLRVRNASNFLRSSACRILMQLRATRKKGLKSEIIEGLLAFGSDIIQTNPRVVNAENPLTPINSDASRFSFRLDGEYYVELDNVDVNKANPWDNYNNNEVLIPVLWDMKRVKNPIEDHAQYCISLTTETFSSSGVKQSLNYDLPVTLKRNRKEMDMEVRFIGEESEVVKSGTELKCLYPFTIPDMVTKYEIQICNSAEFAELGKEDARIFIKDCSLPISLGSGVTLKRGVRQTSLFTIVDENNENADLRKEFTLGIRGCEKICLLYDHSCIDSMRDDNGNIVYEKKHKLHLAFKYYVDKENEYSAVSQIDDSKFRSFILTIPFYLRKASKPEWLCVDLGTSAIVASYGRLHDNAGFIAQNQLKLGDIKVALMESVHRSDRAGNKKRDTSETDMRFINSVMAVNKLKLSDGEISTSLSDDYNGMSLWLSPTTGMVDFYARMLPNLKSIVGYERFPVTLLPYEVTMDQESPIMVKTIFENVYRQLFKFFVPTNCTKETDNIIMTVPNTYTPSNIATLRSILKHVMPQLRYARFISESDAVVFYYLSRREQIFKNTKDYSKVNIDNDVDNDILVYDMGAGTLDLTYVTRSYVDEKINIDFKGKLGVSRAGNYLDYLIAEIIVDIIKEHSDNDTSKQKIEKVISLDGTNLTPADRKSAGLLKEFARNIVKPMLNDDDSTKISVAKEAYRVLLSDPAFGVFGDLLNAMTIGDIKHHTKMKEYLKEISVEVFTHFNILFSNGDNVVRPTLLIFSGRSTSLSIIRDAVKSALSVFGCTDCKFLDLANECIDDDVKVESSDISSLKTVVVDGAMAFCKLFGEGNGRLRIHNKNVYAQYGVMFLLNDGTWEWVPMIDTKTRAINEDSAEWSDDGTIIYEYDTRVHRVSNSSLVGSMSMQSLFRNFNDVAGLYVLQSYSHQTKKDWEEGKRDLITIIGAIDNLGGLGNREYYMTINKENSIKLNIGIAEATMYPRADIISESFKKSMWPIIEKVTENK